MGFWWRPLSTLSAISLIALVLWGAGGKVLALEFAVVVLLIYLLRQLWQDRRLARWLEHGCDRPAPDDIGVWGDIFYRLEKVRKSQNQNQSELASALGQFQHAAEAVPDGIVILNQQDQILWCNPASKRFLGLECKRDQGQFIHYLLRQTDFVSFRET